MKGALKQDKAAHYIYDFACDIRSGFSNTGIPCAYCINELQAYYCEERVYMVRCTKCQMVAVVEASNLAVAALSTFGTLEKSAEADKATTTDKK